MNSEDTARFTPAQHCDRWPTPPNIAVASHPKLFFLSPLTQPGLSGHPWNTCAQAPLTSAPRSLTALQAPKKRRVTVRKKERPDHHNPPRPLGLHDGPCACSIPPSHHTSACCVARAPPPLSSCPSSQVVQTRSSDQARADRHMQGEKPLSLLT